MPTTDTLVRQIFVKAAETITLTNAGSTVVSGSGSTLPLTMDLNGRKILVQMTVSESCAGDGAVDIAVDASIDEANWYEVVASASLDLDTTGLNTVVGSVDLTLWAAPYWRIRIFTDGTDLVDPCSVVVSVASVHVGSGEFFNSHVLAP